MKTLCCVILGLAALAAATPVLEDKLLTMDFKEKQLLVMKLLLNVQGQVMHKDIEELGRDYRIENNMDCYIRTDIVKRFLNIIKVGVLPRGEIFTLHVDRQLKEVVEMFHMLYYAKDFATFIKTACWMRMYMNEGMFVYAMTVACRHRDDCKGLVLPAPYEIYPYYFVRADVIQKAYLLKMKNGMLDRKLCDFYGIKETEKNVFVIDENIYDTRIYLSDEDQLRYFTEDIDLNTYYFYFHVDYPFWMETTTMNDMTKTRRFELMTYFYQQILARYYLERLSNGLGEIETLSWDKPVVKGYWPWIMLHNGVQLPMRSNNYVILRDDNVDVLRLVESYEVIIKEAIIKGFVTINGMRLEITKHDDIEKLGKMIFGYIEKPDMTMDKKRVDAYRYLLIIMKSFLGLNTMMCDKYFVVPTILDQYETALRDPIFYQLQKRIISYVMLFKLRLPSYTTEDLYFPGVKIENILVDKLVTFFDDYLMDMTNAVTFTNDEVMKGKNDMTFLVRKRRMNNQPFKITMEIMSDKAIDSVVRIFMGPKVDHMGRLIDINKNRVNFVELDSFMYKLITGKNVIIRNSIDMHNLVGDRMMTRNIWKKIETVSDIKELFMMKEMKNVMTGFPTRLILPKGRIGGLEMMLYVIVSPLKLIDNVDQTMAMDVMDSNRMDTKRITTMNFRSTVLLDKMPLGFPLDRHIDVSRFFTPNMKFVDVMVFHKRMECDMKTRWQKWVLKDYDLTNWSTVESDTYFMDKDM